jgi:hypothetical protein
MIHAQAPEFQGSDARATIRRMLGQELLVESGGPGCVSRVALFSRLFEQALGALRYALPRRFDTTGAFFDGSFLGGVPEEGRAAAREAFTRLLAGEGTELPPTPGVEWRWSLSCDADGLPIGALGWGEPVYAALHHDLAPLDAAALP